MWISAGHRKIQFIITRSTNDLKEHSSTLSRRRNFSSDKKQPPEHAAFIADSNTLLQRSDSLAVFISGGSISRKTAVEEST